MRRIRLLGFVALAGACGRAGDGGGAAVTRDSAGVSIVENTGPVWREGEAWRVLDSVLVDVSGDIDSVAGPVPLSDGGFAIAVVGSYQIRTYDAAGALRHTSGRSGSGPGEYQMFGGIWVGAGDSILVSDFLVRRLSVVGPDGAYNRSFSLGGQCGTFVPVGGRSEFGIPQGWLADGSIPAVNMNFTINQARQGRYRDSVNAIRYGADGSVLDTLAKYPGVEFEQVQMTIGAQSFSAPMAVPLGRQSVGVAQGDRFYLAQNNTWEIEVRGKDGTLMRLIRLKRDPEPITPEDVTTHRAILLEAVSGNPMLRSMPPAIKSQLTSGIEKATYPETFPFIENILIDPAGNVWVKEVQSPRIKAGVFAVLDSTGTLLGRVTMPAEFRATAFGTDRVYGVWKDADDLQHVRIYALRKGP